MASLRRCHPGTVEVIPLVDALLRHCHVAYQPGLGAGRHESRIIAVPPNDRPLTPSGRRVQTPTGMRRQSLSSTPLRGLTPTGLHQVAPEASIAVSLVALAVLQALWFSMVPVSVFHRSLGLALGAATIAVFVRLRGNVRRQTWLALLAVVIALYIADITGSFAGSVPFRPLLVLVVVGYMAVAMAAVVHRLTPIDEFRSVVASGMVLLPLLLVDIALPAPRSKWLRCP